MANSFYGPPKRQGGPQGAMQLPSEFGLDMTKAGTGVQPSTGPSSPAPDLSGLVSGIGDFAGSVANHATVGSPKGPPMLQGGAAYDPPRAAPTAPAAPGQEGVLSGPGYEEDWYKKYGQDLMGGQSSSERLYDQGAAGSNPFYDNAQQETIKAINDASAARGNSNSSFTMRNIGRAVADLRGQQAHELGQLAGQSDRSRAERYNLSSNFASGAQDATEGRVRGAAHDATDLADRQANQVNKFYDTAGKEMGEAEVQAIQAQLKAAGLSAAEIENLTKAGGEVLAIALKAFA